MKKLTVGVMLLSFWCVVIFGVNAWREHAQAATTQGCGANIDLDRISANWYANQYGATAHAEAPGAVGTNCSPNGGTYWRFTSSGVDFRYLVGADCQYYPNRAAGTQERSDTYYWTNNHWTPTAFVSHFYCRCAPPNGAATCGYF